MIAPVPLAPAGSTGNNTHAAAKFGDAMDADAAYPVIGFKVEAVGATPTVTYKVQGCYDGTSWFDLWYVPTGSDTASAATTVVTATGETYLFAKRHYPYLRLVTTANTNVTYSCQAYGSELAPVT